MTVPEGIVCILSSEFCLLAITAISPRINISTRKKNFLIAIFSLVTDHHLLSFDIY